MKRGKETGRDWVSFCDSSVKAVTWEDVQKKHNSVYICFYRMTDVELWTNLGLLMNE